MTKQEIIERIKKVKRLAESGVEGEKENAQSMVDELMNQYGITESDLEDEKEEVYTYYIDGVFCWELFKQVSIVRYGVDKIRYIKNERMSRYDREAIKELSKGKKTNVLVVCTAAKFIEMTAGYEIYQRGLNDDAKAFRYAFLAKNNLLAPATDDGKEMTEDEVRMVRKAIMMSDGVDRLTVNKLIEA